MQPLPLAHGFLAAKDYGVGVVDDSVADGVSQINEKLWEGRYSPKLPNGARLARNVYVRTPLCKISSTGEIEQRFRLN